MNSLACVLTQKIANDFLEDNEAVAFGNVNNALLQQLLGSQYRMKQRASYQVIGNPSTECADIWQMNHRFGAADERSLLPPVECYVGTVAHSQPLVFNHKKMDTEEEEDEVMSTPAASRPPPISLAFTRIENNETDETTTRKSSYRIRAPGYVRLARSDNPRTVITDVRDLYPVAIDSEEDDDECGYNNELEETDGPDDGRQGRPEMAHFNFLPASVRHLDISSTILLSPQVAMSTLHRVESLRLGTIWPWLVSPTVASSYWPPHLKRLQFGRCFSATNDDHDHEKIEAAVTIRRLFSEIDIRQITFPSTLTELELPGGMYELFNEEESKQFNAIQYPTRLIKLIRPFIPHRLAGWRLPQSLTYLDCQLNPEVADYDISHWQLPSSLLTLIFSTRWWRTKNTQDLSSLRLPDSLTSLTLYRRKTLTIDSIAYPPSLTRMEFGQSEYLPEVPSSYVWPSHLKELKLQTDKVGGDTKSECYLPSTLRHLSLRVSLQGSLTQPKLPEGLESIDIEFWGWSYRSTCAEFALPSTLKKFLHRGSGYPPPQFQHTQLTHLHLLDSWNESIKANGFQLPETLKSLCFGNSFNQPLDHLRLPAGLTELQFGASFSQSLAPLASQMPRQLRILTLGTVRGPSNPDASDFAHLSSLMDLSLPSSLSELVIPSPSSAGIILSPFHTRYTDFVNRLEKRSVSICLIASRLPVSSFGNSIPSSTVTSPTNKLDPRRPSACDTVRDSCIIA